MWMPCKFLLSETPENYSRGFLCVMPTTALVVGSRAIVSAPVQGTPGISPRQLHADRVSGQLPLWFLIPQMDREWSPARFQRCGCTLVAILWFLFSVDILGHVLLRIASTMLGGLRYCCEGILSLYSHHDLLMMRYRCRWVPNQALTP